METHDSIFKGTKANCRNQAYSLHLNFFVTHYAKTWLPPTPKQGQDSDFRLP